MARLHRHVLGLLIADITSGAIEAGDQLPREVDLATIYGVSRGVARECARALEERRLVEVKHGRGAIVLPREEWNIFDPEVLAALLAVDKGERLLTEYLECRRIIEIEAAGLAAERATDEDRREMASAFERMLENAEKSTTSAAAESRYRDADIQFHRSILRSTKNRALARTAEPIYEALTVVLPSLAHPEARTGRAVPQHAKILSAIEAGQPKAAREAMRRHHDTQTESLREHFKELAAAGA